MQFVSGAGQQCLSCSNVESAQSCQHHISCGNTEVFNVLVYYNHIKNIVSIVSLLMQFLTNDIDNQRTECKMSTLSRKIVSGNDNIHELTSHSNHDLRIELEDFNGNTRYAEYSTFSVGDEGGGYRLLVSNYSGNAGDALHQHNSMKFSTFDRGNSPHDSYNCAVRYKAAWWYYVGCHYSNLNGKYLAGHHVSWADGIEWYPWKDAVCGITGVPKSTLKKYFIEPGMLFLYQKLHNEIAESRQELKQDISNVTSGLHEVDKKASQIDNMTEKFDDLCARMTKMEQTQLMGSTIQFKNPLPLLQDNHHEQAEKSEKKFGAVGSKIDTFVAQKN
ncbi:Fibrinogen C domain-containing protein 1,Fibrinogen C domain-containing protein 1-B,Ficolin-2,Fibrinogen C domain-containing protein 1-A [Mytilus edulis]|uniref:Fibrinogen C domain-containing protein 1,Fibrinogen C domain-containing protein 1-B,Ficolin-2,Fibrinogen C domain-containing protein 1-A n=1 Tax=Mytilus edulis TaxID=6550 RepID=A0A8S3PNN0_MYTED|nr:Fibrinogen C domain-containing protein 1,Fibrinogen C domain-containing protein 1-B,Ficolin-2,Fibrinogen C domain-containing protein 1-A [Mytilus edulis]